MRSLFMAVLLAAASLMPGPSVAASIQALPVSNNLGLARHIVELIEPEARMLQIEMRGWEIGMRAVLRADPAIAKLEAEYPGTIAAGIEAGRPLAARYIPQALAKLRASKAKILADGLTIAELEEFRAFAASDVGQRYFSSIQKNADVESIADDVVQRASETGEVVITERDAGKTMSAALRTAQHAMSTSDTLAIMKFNKSPVGKKVAALAAEATKAALEVANNPDPQLMEQQGQAVADAIIAFVEKNQKRR